MQAPKIAIGIPVRNEAKSLPDLLHALATQTIGPGAITACFLLDGCEDDSETILAQHAAQMPFEIAIDTLPYGPPNAGRARAASMRLCLEVLDDHPDAVVLTTDGDTSPAPDWVERSCLALETVDVVAGHILRRHRQPGTWRTRMEDYFMDLHTVRRALDPIEYDPLPSHPSLGGASLGFRTKVYRALGGFAEYIRGEDIELVGRCRKEGYRVRHDSSVRVLTSDRLVGRVPGGLADELKTQTLLNTPPYVPDPVVMMRHFEIQAGLRRAYGTGAFAHPAHQLGLSPGHLEDVAHIARTSDAFVEWVAPIEAVAQQNVRLLPDAERDLMQFKSLDTAKAVA
ncbi:glycosyltransferase family 2 protein [Hyphomonas oceanitis]|uniref:glycosyltransferase n=1 Tax=Hyphomonas oceanitis TaxID=81033 RepID=UPI0030020DF2